MKPRNRVLRVLMTLGFSRKAVFLLTRKSSSRTWCELHEEAFRRLGGTPQTVVLDNLEEGVLAADLYDPTLTTLVHDESAVGQLPDRTQEPLFPTQPRRNTCQS